MPSKVFICSDKRIKNTKNYPKITMRKIKITLLSVLICSVIQTNAQTCRVSVSDTVTNPTPIPFGLNWLEGNQSAFNNYTDDPGMGRQIIRSKGTLDGGGSTYAQHAAGHKFDIDSSIYTGMFNGGNIRIYRETPTGITKVRDETVTTFFADPVNGYRANFASGPPVQAGDIYIISIEVKQDLNQYCHPRFPLIKNGTYNTWTKLSNTGNPSLVVKQLDSTDKPADGGSTSCKMVNTDPANTGVGIGQYFSSSVKSGDFAFNPAKTYRFSVWLKQNGISGGQVTLNTDQTHITHSFTVTSTWQQYTYDVSGINPIATGSLLDFLSLTFDGTGTLWIDNFLLYDLAYPPLTLLPNIQQQLIDYKPYDIRIWSGHLANTVTMGTNLDDWTDTEMQSAKLWDLSAGPTQAQALKLPTILPICENNAIAPYLICSPPLVKRIFWT